MTRNLFLVFKEMKENIDYTITDAIQNPSNMDIGIFYQFAPYLVMHTNSIDAHLTEAINAKATLWVDILYKAKIFLIVSCNDYTISKVKSLLLSIRKDILYSGMNLVSVIEYIDSSIAGIRKYQYENHQMESALINYAAIVPYTQVIKKPGMENPISSDNKFLPQKELISNIGSEITKESLLEKIKEIFHQSISNIFTENQRFISDFDSFVSSILSTKQDEAHTYFILTYWYNKFDTMSASKVINLNDTIRSLFASDNIACDMLLEALTELSSDNFDFRNINEDKIFYEADRYERKSHSPVINSVGAPFDTSIIDSFISRYYDRFDSNEYANNEFTRKNGDIDTYIGASDRMIYIMDDDTLAVPVIDRGEFDKVKVIYLSRTGKIRVENL